MGWFRQKSTSVIAALASAFLCAASLAANVPPEYTPPPTNPVLREGGTAQNFNLPAVFRDPDVSTAVRMTVRLGNTFKNIDLALFAEQKPVTVTNFLRYVNDGLAVANIIHRSVPGFIIQGGGFGWASNGLIEIPTYEQIANEPGISNLRGTIAMAKLPDNPNSATSQWFINLADNSANLDGQNGGFTVFGRVLRDGMLVADEIAALPRYNLGGAFTEIPLKNVTDPPSRVHTVETNTQRIAPLSISATSLNPSLVTATVNGGTLTLTPAANQSGTTVVTLTATDLDGESISVDLPVTVVARASGWHATLGEDNQPQAFTLDPANTETIATNELTINWGLQPTGTPVTRTFTLTNLSSETLSSFSIARSGPAAADFEIVSTAVPSTFGPNANLVVNVRFHPSANGIRTANLRVAGNDPNQPALDIVLTGKGILGAEITGAYSGAPVPTTGSEALLAGSTMVQFGVPALSDAGAVASKVTILSGRARLAGIFLEEANGSQQIVAHQGESAGVPGGFFKSFLDPLLAPNGKIAFGAKLTGVPAANNEGLWSDAFGTLQAVLQKGNAVPGTGGLKLKAITSISLENNAIVAALKLAPQAGLVSAANDTALIRLTGPGTATVLARTGAPLAGSTIKQISVLQPAARSIGQGRWTSGSNTIAKVTLADRRTALVRIFSDGTQTVLLEAGAFSAAFGGTIQALSLPSLGGDAVSVLATLAKQPGITGANDQVILQAGSAGQFSTAVREEAGADNFFGLSDPATNAEGEMAFFATRKGAGSAATNVSGLWITDGTSEPELVAALKAPAPGKDAQPLPAGVWSALSTFILPGGPNSGPVFVGQLSGSGLDPKTKTGLWALDSQGDVRLLLRTGENIALPTGTKRLTGISLLNALPGSFGARRSYNATGGVAVLATFSDRTQALLRLIVP
jgi:cyclophilin family peptidyl-prolyl cis-trans isomerase